MTNRFYTSDQGKWFGPTHLGSAYSRDTAITKFIWDAPDGSPVAKLRSAYAAAVDADKGLRAKRQEFEASGKFTDLGISENSAEHAVIDQIPAVRRAKKVAENVISDVTTRYNQLQLAEPTDTERKDFEELRSMMRAMSAPERDRFVQQNRQNPLIARAIATSEFAQLSGIGPMVHRHIRGEQLEREHGETIAELRDLEEIARIVERTANVAREQLRKTIGVSHEIFEKIAQIGEASGGELPFKIERQFVGGQQVEVARVYDLRAKRWRDAKSDEIKRPTQESLPDQKAHSLAISPTIGAS